MECNERGVCESSPMSLTSASSTNSWNRPMALEPPPTHASRMSGLPPILSKHCWRTSLPMTAWKSRTYITTHNNVAVTDECTCSQDATRGVWHGITRSILAMWWSKPLGFAFPLMFVDQLLQFHFQKHNMPVAYSWPTLPARKQP